MRTLKIEVYATTESDLEDTLEYVVDRLEQGFTSGSEHYDEKGFTFTLEDQAEPAEEAETGVCPACGYEWGSSGKDDPCPECGHIAAGDTEEQDDPLPKGAECPK